jgi:hypothetical protein
MPHELKSTFQLPSSHNFDVGRVASLYFRLQHGRLVATRHAVCLLIGHLLCSSYVELPMSLQSLAAAQACHYFCSHEGGVPLVVCPIGLVTT